MELKRFKILSTKYSKLPMKIVDMEEYDEYVNAINADGECSKWYLKEKVKAAGINYKKYCCLNMSYNLIEFKSSKQSDEINYDSVIMHNRGRTNFGIPIHDGGSSMIKINFCPWCGSKL